MATQLGSGTVAVAVGRQHSLYLQADGSILGVGLNDFGQLGTGNTIESTAVPLAAFGTDMLAISAGERWSGLSSYFHSGSYRRV